MIHVCYGLYDKDGRYSKFCGTSIVSIFENTDSDVTIHILHDDTLMLANRDKLNFIAGRYNQNIKFYNVESLIPEKIQKLKEDFPNVADSSFSIASMYRLFIPELLPSEIEKIIYLDSGDTLVNRDIKDLWNINIADKPVAVVTEASLGINKRYIPFLKNFDGLVKDEDYFNSGVMLFNLRYIREKYNIITNGREYDFLIQHSEFCAYPDQDILNYYFASKALKLPTDFNCSVRTERLINPNSIGNKIYHFNGGGMDKIGLDTNDVFNRLYMNYFSKTPWFNVDMISRIADSIHKIYNERQNLLLHMTNLLARKKRAFFTEKNNVEALRKVFAIQPDEEVIDFNYPPPLCLLKS